MTLSVNTSLECVKTVCENEFSATDLELSYSFSAVSTDSSDSNR